MLPRRKTGITRGSEAAELGEGGKTSKEFDEKASTSSSDLTTSWPEGGLAHHWGQTVTVTCPCSLAVPHMQEAEYQDSGGKWLFLLNGKQTGDLIMLLWPGCLQTKL